MGAFLFEPAFKYWQEISGSKAISPSVNGRGRNVSVVSLASGIETDE
jgi:hypothetical protein